MQNEQQMTLPRLLNRSAIKSHALACSNQFRAGKFNRVGEDFIDEVVADFTGWINKLNEQWMPHMHEAAQPTEGLYFVTGDALEKIQANLDKALARLIQSKVQRQPSVGQTLRRTR